ncbi:23S rRNA (pseudouridine(1915)-N(3))-methyltransferase RlmH [bacterium]|nr:23S rRNA (pseudouridine(1915)-N(3))-methyltransferase RlmH [bacterium]
MNIKIIAVGKIKEKYTKEWIKEFEKRLSAYCSFSVEEISAEPILDENSYEKYKITEGEKILSHIKQEAFVITLEIKGKTMSSENFAQKIKEISLNGINELIFVIGGANGLSQNVSDRADLKLSFSEMTFTHQMIRLILIEQIYRAFKIINRETYHR